MSDFEQLADRVYSELLALADPKRVEGERAYFKGTINNIGCTLPQIERIERSVCRDMAKTCTVDEAMEFCDVLLRRRIFELTLFAMKFLERFSDRVGEAHLERFEQWLECDLCDNWAATDALCPHSVGPIIQRHPELAPRLLQWAESENRWLRRGAAVSLVILLRQGLLLDLAYSIASKLILDKDDDLVQKGCGWMLREAGKTNPDMLEQFLLRHGPNIPRVTIRYALEKFPKEKRSELLQATKRRLK